MSFLYFIIVVHRYEILSILPKDLTASFCPVTCLQEYLDGIARKECACRNAFGSKELGLDFPQDLGAFSDGAATSLVCNGRFTGLVFYGAAFGHKPIR